MIMNGVGLFLLLISSSNAFQARQLSRRTTRLPSQATTSAEKESPVFPEVDGLDSTFGLEPQDNVWLCAINFDDISNP